ncbi:hypothetical protein ACEYX6_10160 [Acinetobacter sp. c2-A9]|uniref:hypothetical protein n=1 Tax=Acinetobacter sp. c2-A9 TaxID=3342802 RepID=UPI0035B788E5
MGCYEDFASLHLNYTFHAYHRGQQRNIQAWMVAHAIRYGRRFYDKGAVYYRVGKREIQRFGKICPELKKMNGIHVVTGQNGKILTMFRNTKFKRIGTNQHKRKYSVIWSYHAKD